jgi:hypothetical protein
MESELSSLTGAPSEDSPAHVPHVPEPAAPAEPVGNAPLPKSSAEWRPLEGGTLGRLPFSVHLSIPSDSFFSMGEGGSVVDGTIDRRVPSNDAGQNRFRGGLPSYLKRTMRISRQLYWQPKRLEGGTKGLCS